MIATEFDDHRDNCVRGDGRIRPASVPVAPLRHLHTSQTRRPGADTG